MRKPLLSMATMLAATILVSSVSPAAEPSRQAAEQKTLNVLFIGNSFTACHNLRRSSRRWPRPATRPFAST